MVKHSSKKITSLHHPLVKHLVKIRENKIYRETAQTVLVPGKKLVKELAVLHTPKTVFALEESLPFEVPPTHLVTLDILKKVTGLSAPEGILAEFPLPQPSSLEGKSFLLILDQITDPGNLGTILRTALALGWEGIFFLPGCVDPFNEKVIRSSRGACFRLPFEIGNWEKVQEMATVLKAPVFLADLEGTPLNELTLYASRAFLILSNEAKGISTFGEKAGVKVTIPMPGSMESLNVAVAGGILMYYIRLLSK